MPQSFDVIVIGGGPTGEHFAGKASERGLNVAIVEKELVGGECSYWACIPSKTLLRPVQLLAEVARVPGAKEAVTGPVDVEAALARRNWMTSDWTDDGQVEWLAGAKVQLVRGHGRLSGPKQVEVESSDGSKVTLEATVAVVIAVGSAGSIPPIPGLSESAPWGNREITSAKQVPRRLVIIGGGVVGVEMAQAWKRLGSETVTVIEVGPRLLANLEPFVGDQVAAAFAAEGIQVHLEAKIESVERAAPDGPVTVHVAGGLEVVGDALVVAAGRRARTEDLGLETVGLEAGRAIAVDDALRASGVADGWLYVIGDANGRALLTHMGKYQGRIVADILAGGAMRDDADHTAVTGVIFTDPQIATVGFSESQAREHGIDVKTVKTDIGGVAGSSIWGDGLKGTCQIVVDRSREVIVGATFVGAPVGEMLHAATIAVVGAVPLSRLRHAVPAFPTLSEIWLELVESYFRD